MNTDIICNLVTGRLGRSSIGQRRPQFFYGQSSIINFYFEDYPETGDPGEAPDGYAGGLVNVNKDAESLVVKIAAVQGGTPIVTASSWANLSTNVSISQSFNNHKLVFSFEPTPVRGYFTIAATASATYALATEYPTGAAVPALSSYSHSIFRDATSGKIFAAAYEGDIEDALRAMLHEIVSGQGGNHAATGPGQSGVPDSGGLKEPYTWLGYALSSGIIAPVIIAQQVEVNEYNVQFYVPDFSQTVRHVFNSSGDGDSGVPDSGGLSVTSAWASVQVEKKGTIVIDTLSVSSSNLQGPRGKSGTIAFTDAQFATLLGSNAQAEAWMEILLDGSTVAHGSILINKPSP